MKLFNFLGKKLFKGKPDFPGLHVSRTKSKALVYSSEFKGVVKANSGAINAFMEARKTGAKELRSGRIMVRRMEKFYPTSRKYWRVDVAGKSFFVKEANQEGHAAFDPISVFRRLEEILPKNFETAEYHLGWKDGKTSFFVTKFYELAGLDEQNVPSEVRDMFGFVERRAEEAGIRIGAHNAFFDPKDNKVIVFDANLLP